MLTITALGLSPSKHLQIALKHNANRLFRKACGLTTPVKIGLPKYWPPGSPLVSEIIRPIIGQLLAPAQRQYVAALIHSRLLDMKALQVDVFDERNYDCYFWSAQKHEMLLDLRGIEVGMDFLTFFQKWEHVLNPERSPTWNFNWTDFFLSRHYIDFCGAPLEEAYSILLDYLISRDDHH